MIRNIFLILVLSGLCFSQTKFKDRISVGVQAEYISPGGDLGKYWGKTFSAGAYLNYKVSSKFNYELSVNFSKFSENEVENLFVPEITMIAIPVGGEIIFPLDKKFDLSLFLGIENTMMIFDETDEQESNLDESEFSTVISLRANYKPFSVGFFISYKNMFSSPESTSFISFGLRKRLF